MLIHVFHEIPFHIKPFSALATVETELPRVDFHVT